jgi:hypothetical protein
MLNVSHFTCDTDSWCFFFNRANPLSLASSKYQRESNCTSSCWRPFSCVDSSATCKSSLAMTTNVDLCSSYGACSFKLWHGSQFVKSSCTIFGYTCRQISHAPISRSCAAWMTQNASKVFTTRRLGFISLSNYFTKFKAVLERTITRKSRNNDAHYPTPRPLNPRFNTCFTTVAPKRIVLRMRVVLGSGHHGSFDPRSCGWYHLSDQWTINEWPLDHNLSRPSPWCIQTLAKDNHQGSRLPAKSQQDFARSIMIPHKLRSDS